MKRGGRITDWNHEKGFGFVVPHGGGTRAFVHLRSLQPGSRRPVDGDLVSYQQTRDPRGRTNAQNVALAGQEVAARRSHRALPRRSVASVLIAVLAASVATGRAPVVLLFALLAASLISYVMYWRDKAAACKGGQRTPEATLHLVDMLGGWPGALLAQHQFRHKTAKPSFQSFFWFTVLANIGLNAWLVHSGTARVAADMLGG